MNNKKILVIEDDEFLQSAYRVKLSKAGFEVYAALDGNEAFNILNDVKPDLILLDLIMPNRDGFSTLEGIKANEKWKDTPILIATNLSQKADIEKGLAMGATDYIVKSDLSLDDVVKKISELI